MEGSAAVSGAVLAGGSSRRMGTDKRWVAIDGVALLLRSLAAVAAVAEDVHLVTASPGDAAEVARRLGGARATLGERLCIDVDSRYGEGPVAGIETALDAARHDIVVVLAADHPFVPPGLLQLLTESLEQDPERLAAAVISNGRAQPLLAAYRREARHRVSAFLDRGHRRARALLDDLDAMLLGPQTWRSVDPSGSGAVDLDTPSDLRSVTDLALTDAAGDAAVSTRLLDAKDRSRALPIVTVRDGAAKYTEDDVVGEDPLEIRACGPGQDPVTVMTTMRTRGNDADLAVGWLFSEGLLQTDGIDGIHHGDPFALARPEDQVTVELTRPLALGDVAHRHAAATASCGVCGRASIDALAGRARAIGREEKGTAPLCWSTLAALPDQLRAEQRLFATTGGIHATGLFTVEGELVTLREDVGRHNALDAVIGAHVRAGEDNFEHFVAVLSGRIGFELVAKAAVAGIPVVAAVGAPSTLAVRTAERFGITLVGFLRRGDGNVYSHPKRLDLGP